MAKVSVIIPAYNSEQFLGETLESLLRQTLSDFEVIIVNDGSTDATQKIIDEYTKKYDNFKGFSQENAGVSAARNNGLMKAAGKYVVFLDADDYYSDESLEAFYNAAEENEADLVLGRLKTFGDDIEGKYNEAADKLAFSKQIDTFDKTLLWSFLVGNKCYNREKLVSSGVRFPPYKYSEEGAFFMSFVYTGAKICGAPGSCMYYRRHTEKQGYSVSQTVTTPLAKSFSQSLDMIYRGAQRALENAGGEADREDYLQEIIYKTAFILLMQFYRPFWRADDTLAGYCGEELDRLCKMMTPKTLERITGENRDIRPEKLVRSKSEAAENPMLTVIVRDCEKDMTQLFDSLYSQICPLFEVIVSRFAAESGRIPERYLKAENLRIVGEENFFRHAKKAARSKNIVVFSSPVRLDVRTFRMIYRLPLPSSFRRAFFSVLIKAINFMLVKRIVK